jgi:Tol biopolymer transport system component/tetratricopeptide (TPR) repeat protein
MTSETTLVDAALFPRLIVRAGGRVVEEVELRGDLTIGRAEDNDLQLADPKASRHHARIVREGLVFVVSDLESANGTRINGIRITTAHPLEHGDRVSVGDTELTYQEPGRATQDTMPMARVSPGVETAAPPTASLAVPRPTRPANRGLVIGIAAVAAVVVLAVVAILLALLAPGFYERIGLVSGSPTASVPTVSASPTSPSEPPTSTAASPTESPSTVDSQEVDDLLTQADALARRSKFEEAIAIYEHLAELVPDDARTETGWACALILDDQAEQALAHAQRAVDLDPESADAAAVLGRVHVALGNKTEALSWAQQAEELDPLKARTQAVLADAYSLNGQIPEAVEAADLALVQDINNAEAHRVRGWLYLVADNDIGRGAGELQIAAGLQPELWLRRHDLGDFLLEAEDYLTALMAFQDALAIRPKAVTYTAIGEAYYSLGQYDQARASLQQAISLEAGDADTHALLGASLAQQGRCDEAETYLQLALATEPSHPLARLAEEICQGDRPTATAAPETPTATPESTQSSPTSSPSTASLKGQIAFPAWNAEKGKYDVYIANVDGSSRRMVAAEMHQPALSPDGAWLAMNGTRSGYEHLTLARADGSDLREITQFAEDGQPAWSADGQKLALGSFRHGDKQARIYIIDQVPFEGGRVDARPVNDGRDDVRGQMPAWTSDGRIVFQSCHVNSPREQCDGIGLYVVSAAGGPQTPRELTEHPSDSAPAVSGTQIAFMSNRDENWEIYVMGIDGSGLKRLTNNAANDGLPTWSPDGRTIAFVSDQGGAWAIWSIRPDGTGRRKLFAVGADGLKLDWLTERIAWVQ